MSKFSLLLFLLVGSISLSSADAQQPLQADLNPALYTPNVTYYDTGSGQNFYYDSASGQFMIVGPVAAPAVASYGGGGIDYAACYAKAVQIAQGGVLSHLNSVIGAFEGIGMGGSPDCATCVPPYGMTLSGDASVQGWNGLWYRVRAWR